MASTPLRALRISDELWRSAQARAAACEETVSEVVRRALADYVARGELEAVPHDAGSGRATQPAAASVLLLAQGMIMYRLGSDADAAAAHLRELAETWVVDLEEAARRVAAAPVAPTSLDQP